MRFSETSHADLSSKLTSRDAEGKTTGDYVRLFKNQYILEAHAKDLSASTNLDAVILIIDAISPTSVPCHAKR